MYKKSKIGNDYIDLVLPSKFGKPLDQRSIHRSFHNITEKLRLPRTRFHDLRHSHATMLIQQNVNIKLLSERLGHSQIQTTLNIYAHAVAEKLDEVFEKCDH
ncbi:tyrosine-type recombinase/integrase [Bacillus sp. NPDC094106]|uniref:tyrosine-type recombinase/integrase n=1 Tax=Bacillus sp. NPDC094106 TaxID=3363949 RepID=UPI00381236D7